MNVTNVSGATQNGVVSNPNPPTFTKTGSAAVNLQSTTYTQGATNSTTPLNLAAGASETITFKYSIANGNTNDSFYFTAYAVNNTNPITATSSTKSANPCFAWYNANLLCLFKSRLMMQRKLM